MTYSDTLSWMFGRLPMFQREGASAYRKDLTNIRLLCDYLGNPHEKFRSIHVAGTNGKGSTSHMLASIFMESGYNCGLYTSPHLKDFRERITINGNKISEQDVVNFIAAHRAFFEKNDLSFFEMTVGLAFDYFAKQEVDIAIIETGMGGRLDATNIITPELAIITNIGLDHTQFLGNTLALIAREKAGIIKTNIPVVVGEVLPETSIVFEQTALNRNAHLHLAEPINVLSYESDLLGNYQTKNKQTVLTAVRILKKLNWTLPDEAVRLGIRNVVRNTNLQGRWQVLSKKPWIIADTAHNKHGLEAALPQLATYSYHMLHIVLGLVSDKEATDLLPLFPKNALYYFCKPNIPRGRDVNELATLAKSEGLIGRTFESVEAAYRAAVNAANENDLVFIGGSTFVVAEIL
jgi:dihydrofolate synthase/folylpolyglutamate synthase